MQGLAGGMGEGLGGGGRTWQSLGAAGSLQWNLYPSGTQPESGWSPSLKEPQFAHLLNGSQRQSRLHESWGGGLSR